MRIAFSSLACPGWTVEQIADAAGRFGYDAIEWRLADGELLGPRTSDDVWERIATCGVPAVCLDTSAMFVTDDDERRAQAVAIAKAMGQRAQQIGAPAIRVFGGAIPEGTAREALIGPTSSALAAACATVPDGVTCLVETHDAWSTGAEISTLLARADGVGVVWDVAHTVRAGESPRDTLGHVGVPGLVHVKDARGQTLTHLGEGEIPLRDAIDALRADGYGGALSLEWEKLWHPELDDPDVVLPRAIAFLRALTDAASA